MKRNIIYSRNPKYKKPVRYVRIGMTVYHLPDEETQRKGFFVENPKQLVYNVPGYKFLKPLGKR